MVTQIQGFMVPNSIIHRGPFSNTLFHHFPRKFTPNSHERMLGLNVAAFSCFATSPIFYESSEDEENRANSITMGTTEGLELFNLNKKCRISTNHQTYLWLLDGYLNYGSLIDSKKLHGKILKSGFDADHDICIRLIHAYVACGDLEGAAQVFDNLPYRSVSSWNKLFFGFSEMKLTTQMLAKNVDPDESTFAYILRGKVGFRDVKQIHTKIIQYGFGTSTIVCIPLIDLYAKNGFVDTAKQVFESLCFRDNVYWVAVISGLSQSGQEKEGILLFCKMHKSGIMPTTYLLSDLCIDKFKQVYMANK